MRGVIILNNMCVEERDKLSTGLEDEEKEVNETLVWGGVPVLWCDLTRRHGSGDVQVVSEFLAALYKTQAPTRA